MGDNKHAKLPSYPNIYISRYRWGLPGWGGRIPVSVPGMCMTHP